MILFCTDRTEKCRLALADTLKNYLNKLSRKYSAYKFCDCASEFAAHNDDE